MLSTRKESLAKSLTCWYWVSTQLALSTQQLLDRVVAWRTIHYSRGIPLTRFALSCMTNSFAFVVLTVLNFSADLFAGLLLGPAQRLSCQITTKTIDWLRNRTRRALSFMTHLLALMFAAVKIFQTWWLTRKFRPFVNMTWYSLNLLGTKASNLHINIARWASTRMTKNFTCVVLAVLILLLFAILSTAMGQNQGIITWLTETTTVTIVNWKLILSVTKVTVWTCPCVKCQ